MSKDMIKFRAWDNVDDKWRYFVIGQSMTPRTEALYNCLCVEGAEFQQFIGILDKNGNEAYKGDIIYIKYCECVGHNKDGEEIWESRKGVISFEDSMFVFDGHSCGTLPLFAYKDSFEIIGNTKQNPELL